MPNFICVKPTAYRGRQVTLGQKLGLTDEAAKMLEGHPCWQPEAPAASRVTDEELSDADAKAAKELKESNSALREHERLKLLKACQDAGLNPRANTGIAKLKSMLDEAKAKVAAGGGSQPMGGDGSVI